MNKKYTKENLEEIVKNSTSFRQVLNKLNLKEAGGNYSNIKIRIKQFKLDISHFTGQASNKNKTFTSKKSIQDLLIVDSNYSTGAYYSSYKLNKRLIKEGIKKHQCENCLNTCWLDKPISLELHHINGIRNDNRLENLQLLCPNCHSYTDNYRGKNIGK